jgi:hypothetical protein
VIQTCQLSALKLFWGFSAVKFSEIDCGLRVLVCTPPVLGCLMGVFCNLYSFYRVTAEHVSPYNLYVPSPERQWWSHSCRHVKMWVCVLYSSGRVWCPCPECWEVVKEVLEDAPLEREGGGMCNDTVSPCVKPFYVSRVCRLTFNMSFFTLKNSLFCVLLMVCRIAPWSAWDSPLCSEVLSVLCLADMMRWGVFGICGLINVDIFVVVSHSPFWLCVVSVGQDPLWVPYLAPMPPVLLVPHVWMHAHR